MRKGILILIAFLILINSIYATQTCNTYDDFSSSVLNLNKWEEIATTLDEHFVENRHYHTAQLIALDKVSFLKFRDKVFVPGDIVEYDVNYISGSGNRQSRVQIDNVRYSIFGFWNTIEDAGVGNDFGTYHVKITFTEKGLTNEITLPNGTIRHTRPDGVLPSPGLEHTFGVVTRTGHNGIVHMDYDNFIVCSEEQELDLEERISELEDRIEELESRVSLLELLIDRIMRYFNFLSLPIKKRIVCSELEESGEDELERVGLSCEMRSKNNKEQCYCKKTR